MNVLMCFKLSSSYDNCVLKLYPKYLDFIYFKLGEINLLALLLFVCEELWYVRNDLT